MLNLIQVRGSVVLENFEGCHICCFVCKGHDDDITSTSCIMAFLKGELGGSYNLVRGSKRALKRFMTSRLHPMRGWCGPAPKLDAELARKFAKAVDAWMWNIKWTMIWIMSDVIDPGVCGLWCGGGWNQSNAAGKEIFVQKHPRQGTRCSTRGRAVSFLIVY